jgi:IMP dehydrogenase
MPLTNGDLAAKSAQLLPGKEVLDFSSALEILEKEYPTRDGIDAKTLLDSKINGGLTYNDFLILPGYIGISSVGHISLNPPNSVSRLFCG